MTLYLPSFATVIGRKAFQRYFSINFMVLYMHPEIFLQGRQILQQRVSTRALEGAD